MEWQPIETAPASYSDEDGHRFLVWVADGGDNKKGCAAFGHVYKSRRTANIYPQAEGFLGDWKITHWMPLPEPPQP